MSFSEESDIEIEREKEREIERGIKKDKGKPNSGDSMAPSGEMAPAIIVVQLPAEATLTFDHEPTQSTSSSRRFVSPPLERGKEYYYTLTAKVFRNGKAIITTKRVSVRAGEETPVVFDIAETHNVALDVSVP